MKKKLLIIFLILYAIVFKVNAQPGFKIKCYYDTDTVQLKKLLTVAKTDADKIILLHNLLMQSFNAAYATALLQINKTAKLVDDAPYYKLLNMIRSPAIKSDKVIIILQQVISDFDARNIEVPDLLFDLRMYYNDLNRQDEKYKYYVQKLSFYQKRPQIFSGDIAACYHAVAGYYYNKGDYNSSINYYLKAAEAYKPLSFSWYLNEMMVVGADYNEWGNQPKALYYLKMGLEAENRKDIFYNKSFAMLTLANVEYTLNNYNASLNYLVFFDSGYSEWKQNISPAMIETIKALDYIALNKLPGAINLLNAAEKKGNAEHLSIFNFNGYFEVDYGYYKYFMAMRQPGKAIGFLLSAYKKGVASKSVTLRLRYLKELAYFYGDNNNTADAWAYTTVYNKLRDSLETNTNKYKVASYENEMRDNAQNKRVAGLKQESVLQSAAIGKRNMMIWFALAGLVVIGTSLVFIYKQLQVNKKTLVTLRQTQTQLIQSEKMASLGELTAGIAHEIQNPLNFVNNFSEVSVELLAELKEEAEAGHTDNVIAIATDLTQNLEKINHHGKRADSIVKGMLEHSRIGSGEKELVDINVLADEFLKLSYHALRAKDKSFNANLVTHFDGKLPKVKIAQQDIGRVLLNLFNNAFYAVNHKKKTAGADYNPEVRVTTSIEKNNLVITVTDNGNGIPDAIKDKIMQPFFTTKPTGEGTGLGLSLSYDIVVKGHGGSIDVDSKESAFTEFKIKLPIA